MWALYGYSALKIHPDRCVFCTLTAVNLQIKRSLLYTLPVSFYLLHEDNKLYAPPDVKAYVTMSQSIKPNLLNQKNIRQKWYSILRLTVSAKMGTVTSSLMLRVLGRTRRQSAPAAALRELERIERTLFMQDRFYCEALRWRNIHVCYKGYL